MVFRKKCLQELMLAPPGLLPHFKSKLRGNLSPIKLHSCVAGRLVVIRKENHLSIT